jgi:hypothetical protein
LAQQQWHFEILKSISSTTRSQGFAEPPVRVVGGVLFMLVSQSGEKLVKCIEHLRGLTGLVFREK